MADMDEQAFREAILAGSQPGTNDPPERRAAAAATYLADVADAARRGVAAGEVAVEKAEAQLQAAQDALEQARRQQEAADLDAKRAAALNLELNGGRNRRIDAGVAQGSGAAI